MNDLEKIAKELIANGPQSFLVLEDDLTLEVKDGPEETLYGCGYVTWEKGEKINGKDCNAFWAWKEDEELDEDDMQNLVEVMAKDSIPWWIGCCLCDEYEKIIEEEGGTVAREATGDAISPFLRGIMDGDYTAFSQVLDDMRKEIREWIKEQN